jgi:hypothetical protein
MNLNAPASTLSLAIVGLVTLLITTIVPWWLARKAKQQDWDREDKVAEQAAQAAKLLLAANERVAGTSAVMNGKLDVIQEGQKVIHTLVNSNLTSEMEERLASDERGLVSLNEIVRLNRLQGHEPSHEARAVIQSTEKRIGELKSKLKDRFEQQQKIDEQTNTHTAAVVSIRVPTPKE